MLSGFVVGLLVGQTGVGGGSLMTPLLVLLFGIHPATAVGTDLLYAAATKTARHIDPRHARNRGLAYHRRLAVGSVPASLLTLTTLALFNPLHRGTAHFITEMLGQCLS